MRYLLLMGLFFWLFAATAYTQGDSSLKIRFSPNWLQEKVILPAKYSDSKNPDSSFIDVFRCYLSHFELINNDSLVWKEEDSFHLLDASIDSSLQIVLKLPAAINFTSLKFQLGVDSLTSISGAMGGDLDPTKGMFWAWNTGYINFKLEGTNPNCPTRKNKFQFHLGGYAAPWASIQQLEFPLASKTNILINIQLDQFLQKVNLKELNSVMTPGKQTVDLAKTAKTIFHLADEE